MSTPKTVTVLTAIKLMPLLLPCIWLLQRRFRNANENGNSTRDEASGDVSGTTGTDATSTDPGLLKKYSTYVAYHVPETAITYPSLRTFYRPHRQGDKLPSKPTPLPLLVFIHGLGGSIAQFHPLMTSLVNLAPCLAVDLPGCGLSEFKPKSWSAYTSENLAQLLIVVINKHRDVESGQGVVLICHSMGCSLGALLASTTSPYSEHLSNHVLGMVGICPVAEPPDAQQTAAFRKLLYVPGLIFELWRRWDRRGGTESASVARFVGPDAEETTKKLQVLFNEQSRTPVWRRMAWGLLPDYSTGERRGGVPGRQVWAGMTLPLFLVAGEADHITPSRNVHQIANFMGRHEHEGDGVEAITTLANETPGLSEREEPMRSSPRTVSSFRKLTSQLSRTTADDKRPFFLAAILPSPASHALLYAQRTARPLSAHIQTFLASQIDRRLSLGWQLQYLTTEGKWDVKNLAKWQAVNAVSVPIAGIFRAMKTLREVDDSHSPKVFVGEWAKGLSKNGKDGLGTIVAVVDISHESPVYDPKGLEDGGIHYRKFPTVSKLPPTVDEVQHFIVMIDEMRLEFLSDVDSAHSVVAVHCHYGFNRTGFFLIAYMVERLDWTLKAAIEEFAEKRPPGVRHAHFIDELWGRYWTRDKQK